MGMDRLRALLHAVLALFRRRRTDAELDEEIAFHLARETEANLRAGMSPAEARRRALLAFGSTDWHKERVREERGWHPWDEAARDLRVALRNLGRRPLFAAAAILTLSLGIGMTTAMFAVVDAVLLRPLPGSHTRGLVYLKRESSDGSVTASPTPQLLRLVREHARSFSRVEAFATRDFDVRVRGEPLRAEGAMASAGFFSFLGVRPALGRLFLPADGSASGTPVVVLSHAFWTEKLGRDPSVVGTSVEIDGRLHDVVGVLPGDFRVAGPAAIAFWIPDGAAGEVPAQGAPVEAALARLVKGVSPEAAQEELNALVRNDPLTGAGTITWNGRVVSPEELVDPGLARAVLVLQAAAVLVLLIGCMNLTNLLLAQGEARAPELALRTSLGATRGRLVRQLLTESLVLGAAGGAGGLLLALWALNLLPTVLPAGLAGFSPGSRVLLTALLSSLTSVFVVGLLPALRGSRRDLGEVMKGAATRPTWLPGRVGAREILVAAQVAMAFVLLVVGGLLVRSFAGLREVDTGFDARDLVTIRLQLPQDRYGSGEARQAFYRRLLDVLGTGLPPQVAKATVATGFVDHLWATGAPLVPEGAEGRAAPAGIVFTQQVAPGYFDVAGIPLLRGRAFDQDDGRGQERPVVINEALASRYFAGLDPVGRRLEVGRTWYRVVGVAGNIRLPAHVHSHLGELELYFPFGQDPAPGLTVLARIEGDRAAALEVLKHRIRSLDPDLPLDKVAPVDDLIAASLSPERANAILMAIFALTALALGAVGIYGVVAYTVSRRTREAGIRLALGATGRDVTARLMAGGMKPVAVGVGLGAVGAIVCGRTLSALLYGVDSHDPAVFLLVASGLGAVSLIASWLPARRAAGEDPVRSLRAE